jgi:hypothetical protein
MAVLGGAVLAMWWDMAPSVRAELEHWHTHEHFPERLALPGFLRASRWADAAGGEGFFVLYELERHEDLSSPEYQARLNAPTPWSTKLMPHHRNMVRSQCRVLASRGGVVAGHALTLRLAPLPGREAELQAAIERTLEGVATRPGLCGAHLFRTETPAIAATVEQRIRGNDRAADWILVASACEAKALEDLQRGEWSAQALLDAGAAAPPHAATFRLRASMLPADVLS